jgi:heme oxygenase-like protein
MQGHSWVSALRNGVPGQHNGWDEASFAELAAVRDDVVAAARRVTGARDDGWDYAEADGVHRAIARLVLGRFRNPLAGHRSSAGWSPLGDVVLGAFGSVWGNAVAAGVAGRLPPGAMKPGDFSHYVRDIASASRCGGAHPLFGFAAEEASREQLAAFLEAKNLTDINFVNFLTLLMPGADGEPAAEMASNLWDELGHGEVAGFHRNVRATLMRNVGLRVPDAEFDLSPYLLEEVEHFNAYALNGMIRRFSLRLAGMLFANELLAPAVLTPLIRGWRRVGLRDSEMEFLISHWEGDVEHAGGWADRVVAPSLANAPFAQHEVLIGVHQHIEILGRHYDRVLDGLLTGTLAAVLS